MGRTLVIRRLASLAVLALGLVPGPVAAQAGQFKPQEAKPVENGSRPVTGATPTGPNAAPGQRIDSIFEAMPANFERKAVFSERNLHFVPISTKKGNIVLVWGGVGNGDAIRFNAAMSAAKPVVEIQFYSPGGLLYEGMKIGRLIRGMQLATRITAGSACASACNFMFLGGVVRAIEPQGGFGVHMFSDQSADMLVRDLAKTPGSVDEFNDRFPKHVVKRYDVEAWVERERQKNPDGKITERNFFQQDHIYRTIVDERVRDIQQDSAQTAADIAIFLVEMRLSLRFLVEFADQTSYGVRYLTPDQLRSFNIVTN